jgi:hypothetical protein
MTKLGISFTVFMIMPSVQSNGMESYLNSSTYLREYDKVGY